MGEGHRAGSMGEGLRAGSDRLEGHRADSGRKEGWEGADARAPRGWTRSPRADPRNAEYLENKIMPKIKKSQI